jgi:transglutaminase-like putative cysteine protease
MHLEAYRPSFFGAIAGGGAQTPATLELMSRIVRRYKRHSAVRNTALELTQGLAQKDSPGEIRRLFEFVRDRVRYVRDIKGIETLQTPDATLEIGQGDCDDKSTLLAALLETIGYPTRFVAVGSRPGSYSHVYVETRTRSGERWLPLDATEPVLAGWSPRGASFLRWHN